MLFGVMYLKLRSSKIISSSKLALGTLFRYDQTQRKEASSTSFEILHSTNLTKEFHSQNST